VLKPETAITMRQMMESVVIRGTGKKARLDEYTTGGKTGTAQIVDLKTHTYTHLYNASFMGFSPVNNPRVVAVVTVNGTSGLAGYGGEASGPVFKEIVSTALRLGDVPPDVPEDDRPKQKGQPVDTNDLAIADLGSVPNLEPDDAPAAPKAQPDDATAMQIGPKVPNFTGMTMRDVLQQSSARGIPVDFVGSGLVRTQYPAPGNVLPSGERVRVQFSHY
jgi:cell division protein FtsI (penicillin-binding protein 3)